MRSTTRVIKALSYSVVLFIANYFAQEQTGWTSGSVTQGSACCGVVSPPPARTITLGVSGRGFDCQFPVTYRVDM
jgi:hypothetical protein